MNSFEAVVFDPTIGKIVLAVLGGILIHAVFRFFQSSLAGRVSDQDARYRIRKLTGFAGYIVIIFFLGLVFRDQLGGLTVALGVAGAGIAFALQEVIVSVAGWAAISFGGFYRIGDRVIIGGIMGDVIDIGILRTTLMECGQWVRGDNYNGRIARVANSFVFKEPVINYSGDFEFLWDEITVPVRYGSDLEMARGMIESAAQETVGAYAAQADLAWAKLVQRFRIENARTAPMVTMIANDNWVEFTLRYVVDFRRRRVTKDELFTRILADIDRTEGRVKLASATYELTQLPPIEVRLPPAT